MHNRNKFSFKNHTFLYIVFIIASITISLFLTEQFKIAQADITTSLKGYWKFDEGSGTVAVDSSGNGNTGTLTNGPTWITSGKIGGALSFDGLNDYVLCGTSPSLAVGGLISNATWAFWIKPANDGRDGEADVILSKATAYSGDELYTIFHYSNYWGLAEELTANFLTMKNWKSTIVPSVRKLPNDIWSHIAVTYDGVNARIYINGVLDSVRPIASSIFPKGGIANDPCFIGGDSTELNFFEGQLDEVRIYNRVLSSTDITELYNFTGSTPPPTDTIPPTLSGGNPTGTLPAGTTQTTLSVTTNENATCRYSTTSGVAFSAMSNTFSTTGTISHSTIVSGLSNGQTYNYYVRCQDIAGNANTSDFAITFSIASPAPPPPSDTTPPTISSINAGSITTSGTTITWTTNEASDSQVEYGLTTSYGLQTILNTNLLTSHSQTLSGLSASTIYNYRVKSKDAAGNLAVSPNFTFTTASAGGLTNPTLINIPANTALDLGLFIGGDSLFENCGILSQQITDYGRFTYDSTNHQLLMFGGGHASTPRTDVIKFNFSTLAWSSMYTSTPQSAMTLANLDQNKGSWISTGHPVARHTYDHLTFAPSTGELILSTRVEGESYCYPSNLQSTTFWQDVPVKISHYNPITKTWLISSATIPHDGNQGFLSVASEYDPISGMIIQMGGNVGGNTIIRTYDPVTKALTDRLTLPFTDMDITENLVYFPPNDKFYYIRAENGQVWEITLNRADWSQSTIVKLATTGTVPILGTPPNAGETGWAYDSVNRIIGGGITNGVFYAFNPITRAWTSKTMLVQTHTTDTPKWLVFHSIDFDPVDGVFVFLATKYTPFDPYPLYFDSMHTWAYRY